MFFKAGFFVLLAVVAGMFWVFVKSNPMQNEGANSWTEFYSSNPAETIAFLDKTFAIKSEKNKEPAADGAEYNILKAGGQMWPFAGIMELPKQDGKPIEPGTMVYLTVKDFDAAHNRMIANGAKSLMDKMYAGGMTFGIYAIPGGITIGIAKYGKNNK
ncbi:MAG: hypothetical protein LBR69_03580 [Endomicrobium sp.]|jgi:predicted enzyme related to lactoylglutathione lyase|nr:hypothetical protein [Endomicrobium sp.]